MIVRFAIHILVLALSWPLLSPALVAADLPAAEPACCRRDGRHGCDRDLASSKSERFRSADTPSDCPMRCCPVHSSALGQPVSAALNAEMFSSVCDLASSDARLGCTLLGTRRERGPPLTSSLS